MSAAAAPTPATWRQVQARVVRHDDAGAGHRWLELRVPADFAAPAPGQFVQLLIEWPSPVLLPRPMSVASVTRTARGLALGFLYAPVGAGTLALAGLTPSDSVGVLGSLGRGFPLEVQGTPVLLAGGRGVAPLLFAADALARAGRRCTFLFGARTHERLVGLGEARARLRRMKGALHLATDDGSRGVRGTVFGLLQCVARDLPKPLVIHACGPHGMLKAAALWGLRNEVPTFLAMESVMACGTGVCRGCPMPRSAAGRQQHRRERTTRPSLHGNEEYAMCCTEGPVFAAQDLDWERVE